MTYRSRHHAAGSVIIMAVGLLVMLGMIGATFIIISHVDRKEAQHLADAGTPKRVAMGVLGLVVTRLAEDLYIDDRGTLNPADDVRYGLADTEAKRIDFPYEDPADPTLTADAHLSDTVPMYNGVTLVDHFTNIHGDSPTAGMVDTDGQEWTVEYKGQTLKRRVDAVLWDSGMTDRLGRKYWVGVRVIDAGSLVNVNLAFAPDQARSDKTMTVTDLSLDAPLGILLAIGVHKARRGPTDHDVYTYWTNYARRPLGYGPAGAPSPYMPFDMADELMLRWENPVPDMSRGRLFAAMDGSNPASKFHALRRFLTTWSASSIRVMPALAARPQTFRADLNAAGFQELFVAFYNLIPAGVSGMSPNEAGRRRTAAQLAVNLIDFRDADSNVTVADVKADGTVALLPAGQALTDTTVCGIERQPFLVEAAYKREWTAGDPPVINSYYAIELYNPYTTPIDITNWKIKVGGSAVVPIGGATSIPAGGRLVIVNTSAEIAVDGGATEVEVPTLDLSQEMRILRPRVSGSDADIDVVIAQVKSDDDFEEIDKEPEADNPRMEAIRRDDRRADAVYCLARYKSVLGGDITAAGDDNNLGKPNGVTRDDLQGSAGLLLQPVPVYVRNGKIVNLGDVCRIFYVGPTDDTPLDVMLTNMNPYDPSGATGRLRMLGGVPAEEGGWAALSAANKHPAVPLGCLVGEFFMVDSPAADGVDNDLDGKIDSADTDGGEGVVYGRININTFPVELAAFLPLGNMTENRRRSLGFELAAYRHRLANNVVEVPGTGGGANYEPGRADASVGVPNLRDKPGFACVGEAAIAIYNRARNADMGVGAYQLPQNKYSATNRAPYNYTISDDADGDGAGSSDDGLPTAAGQKVANDLVKKHVYYSWASNHLTVRSDVYIAYILVQSTGNATDATGRRRFVAVIDRSRCMTAADRPIVVMFAEIR